MDGDESIFDTVEHASDNDCWCNYPCITKSKYKCQNIVRQIDSDSSVQTHSSLKKSVLVNVEQQESEDVLINYWSSTPSSCNKTLYPDPVVSPWLRFGIEKNPWKEKGSQCLPQIICDQSYSLLPGCLTREQIILCSSNIAPMPDIKKYAMTRLDIANKNLTSITQLLSYRCFQYIDLSWNKLTNVEGLDNMVYLMCLDASHNQLNETACMQPPWYLTYLNLSCNNITSISDMTDFWSLSHINFSHNHINKIEGLNNLEYLQYLNLSHNYIYSLENLGSLNIVELNLEHNNICEWELTGAGTLNINQDMRVIYLNDNHFDTLQPFERLEKLTVLELKNNDISNKADFCYLKKMTRLEKISLAGNTISSIATYKYNVIHYLPSIIFIDGQKVLPEDKVWAKQIDSNEIVLDRYRQSAKLLVYNQVSNVNYPNSITVPRYPVVVLIGAEGSGKTYLAKRLTKEYSQYLYYAVNHIAIKRHKKHAMRLKPSQGIGEPHCVWQEQFNNMLTDGQFLATTEFMGYSYGLSNDEFTKSIEEGKLCIITCDLTMVFCLQALGLNPFIVYVTVESQELHIKRLNTIFQNKERDTCLLSIIYEMMNTKTCLNFYNPEGGPSKEDSDSSLSLSPEESDSKTLGFASPLISSTNCDVTQSLSSLSPGLSVPIQIIYGPDETLYADKEIVHSYHSFTNFKISHETAYKKDYIREPSKKFPKLQLTSVFLNGLNVQIYPPDNLEGVQTETSCEEQKSPKNSNLCPPNSFMYTVLKSVSNCSLRKLAEDEVENREEDSSSDTSSELSFNLPDSFLGAQQVKADTDKILYKVQNPITQNPGTIRLVTNKTINGIRRLANRLKYWSQSCNTVADINSIREKKLSVLYRRKAMTVKDNQGSALMLPKFVMNLITEKVLKSNKQMREMCESGFFMKTIVTDNMDTALEELKQTVREQYNIGNARHTDTYVAEEYNKPLYKDHLQKQVEDLMRKSDATESTDIFKKKDQTKKSNKKLYHKM